MIELKNTEQESERSLPCAGDHAPRQYPFRTSVALTAKLLIIAGSVFVFIWMLDVLLAP